MRKWYSWLCLATVACQTSPPSPAVVVASATASADTPVKSATPWAELDRLDQRKPLPLLPFMANHQKQNMRDHLAAVQEVVAATAQSDFARVAQAAKRIGYSEAMGQMCEHMGAGAPGFSEQALAFHRGADRIAEAASSKDAAAVLSALSATLAACTSCHATYKQKLVATLSD
jgi:hypothetical protein